MIKAVAPHPLHCCKTKICCLPAGSTFDDYSVQNNTRGLYIHEVRMQPQERRTSTNAEVLYVVRGIMNRGALTCKFLCAS